MLMKKNIMCWFYSILNNVGHVAFSNNLKVLAGVLAGFLALHWTVYLTEKSALGQKRFPQTPLL